MLKAKKYIFDTSYWKIMIWYTFLKDCDLTLLDQRLHTFLELLQQRINAYQQEEDRYVRIAGKLLLEAAVQHFYPEHKSVLFQLYKTPQHQPRLHTPPLYFSTAYSKGLCVLSADPRLENGIDVEYRQAGIDTEVYNDFLHPDEQKALLQSQDPESMFYHCWTGKEAVLKAAGSGIQEVCLADVNTRQDPVLWNGQSFYLQQIDIDSDYIVQVASTEPEYKMDIRQLLLR